MKRYLKINTYLPYMQLLQSFLPSQQRSSGSRRLHSLLFLISLLSPVRHILMNFFEREILGWFLQSELSVSLRLGPIIKIFLNELNFKLRACETSSQYVSSSRMFKGQYLQLFTVKLLRCETLLWPLLQILKNVAVLTMICIISCSLFRCLRLNNSNALKHLLRQDCQDYTGRGVRRQARGIRRMSVLCYAVFVFRFPK